MFFMCLMDRVICAESYHITLMLYFLVVPGFERTPSSSICLDPQQTGGWSWGVHVSGGGGGVGYYQNFLSLVGSHLIQRAHSGERTLGSHFVYG